MKRSGCNHMTCGICAYEFCWSCGGSASSGDNHWNIGCGIKMMDDKVKPGDHLKLPVKKILDSTCGARFVRFITGFFKFLCGFLIFLITFPLFLIFFCPILGSVLSYEAARKNSPTTSASGVLRCLAVPIGFCFGFCVNICFIPIVLIWLACALVAMICSGAAGLIEMATGYRFRENGRPIINNNPAATNMEAA